MVVSFCIFVHDYTFSVFIVKVEGIFEYLERDQGTLYLKARLVLKYCTKEVVK